MMRLQFQKLVLHKSLLTYLLTYLQTTEPTPITIIHGECKVVHFITYHTCYVMLEVRCVVPNSTYHIYFLQCLAPLLPDNNCIRLVEHANIHLISTLTNEWTDIHCRYQDPCKWFPLLVGSLAAHCVMCGCLSPVTWPLIWQQAFTPAPSCSTQSRGW